MANQEQSAEEIFGAALDLPPEERSAYLVRACRGSPELRNLVEELLFDYQRMGSFLEESSPCNKRRQSAFTHRQRT